MFKKLLLSFFAGLLLLQSTILPVYAQGQAQIAPWYDTDIRDWYVKVYSQQTSPPSEIFGERYTAAQVQWVVYSLIAVIMNIVFDSNFTACVLGQMGQNAVSAGACVAASRIPQQVRAFQEKYYPRTGVILTPESNLASSGSTLGKLFELTTNSRGSSGISYLKSTFNKITLVPEAKAQEGFGYGELNALREFWVKSRDISYGLLIFAAIILAFMIMFRTKISPQTVISAQSAIPKLIAAIILITFSYAIAGFLIDMVYVVIGLLASVFTDNVDDLERAYRFLTSGPANGGIFGMLMLYAFIFPILFALSFIGSNSTPFDFWNSIEGAGMSLLGIVIILLVFVVVVVVLLVAWLKTLFLLIRTLINIYLAVIFAPFYMVFGTVTPAMGFGTWVRTMISNLAVFPAIGLMFLLAVEFMRQGAQISLANLNSPDLTDAMNWIFQGIGLGVLEPFASGGGWAPPLLNMGDSTGGLMLQFVSLAIITLIPNVGNIIQGFISGRPFAYGTGIGEAFGPITNPAQALRQGYNSAAWQSRYEKMTGLSGGGVWGSIGRRFGMSTTGSTAQKVGQAFTQRMGK